MQSIEFVVRVGDRVTDDSGRVTYRSGTKDTGLVSYLYDEKLAIEEAVSMFRQRLTYALETQSRFKQIAET